MSYPDPVYLGGSGEASARVRRVEDPAELATAAGGACHYLATGATTGGQFGLYRWEMGPEPSGLGQHFHRTMTESFFVLSGTVRIHDGTGWVDTRSRRLHVRPSGRGARLPQRVRCSRGDAHPVHPRCPAGGLLRGSGGPRAPHRAAVGGRLAEFYERHDNYWV